MRLYDSNACQLKTKIIFVINQFNKSIKNDYNFKINKGESFVYQDSFQKISLFISLAFH